MAPSPTTSSTAVPAPRAAVADCGCPDGPASSGLGTVSRRSLLKALGVGAMTLVATENVHTQVAFAAPGYTGDVLVVLSFRGGMDGISAVVPGGDADYYRLRPTIAVPQSQLLALDGTFGLHPALAPLLPLWKAGRLGAVHGVGLPGASRSHFSAMEDMEKAAPGTSLRTGAAASRPKAVSVSTRGPRNDTVSPPISRASKRVRASDSPSRKARSQAESPSG